MLSCFTYIHTRLVGHPAHANKNENVNSLGNSLAHRDKINKPKTESGLFPPLAKCAPHSHPPKDINESATMQSISSGMGLYRLQVTSVLQDTSVGHAETHVVRSLES